MHNVCLIVDSESKLMRRIYIYILPPAPLLLPASGNHCPVLAPVQSLCPKVIRTEISQVHCDLGLRSA